jgi:tetratricopeptide (TPR) repeat protein
VADIDKGIYCLEEALLHDVQPVKGRFLNTLGTLFWKRYIHSGDHSDIEKAILHHKAAARIIPDDNDNPGMFFNNLGNSLFTCFEGQGHLDDLESSISNLEMAKQLISDDHLTKADVYNNLGISLFKRFVRLGEITDINEPSQTIRHHCLLHQSTIPLNEGTL